MMVTHRGQVKKTLWVLEILFLSTLPAPSFEPFFFSKKKKCSTPKRKRSKNPLNFFGDETPFLEPFLGKKTLGKRTFSKSAM